MKRERKETVGVHVDLAVDAHEVCLGQARASQIDTSGGARGQTSDNHEQHLKQHVCLSVVLHKNATVEN